MRDIEHAHTLSAKESSHCFSLLELRSVEGIIIVHSSHATACAKCVKHLFFLILCDASCEFPCIYHPLFAHYFPSVVCSIPPPNFFPPFCLHRLTGVSFYLPPSLLPQVLLSWGKKASEEEKGMTLRRCYATHKHTF